jgi:asparagine synthase (glutamine-hydrolysing)
MCGIFGINRKATRSLIVKVSEILRHRGPDGEGSFTSEDMTLLHRRLSIIDLEGGRQPICNEDGSLWIIFNGEMFNYAEERSTLEAKGHAFKTRSDTEVILHLYEEYGPASFNRLVGQFSIAIWDENKKKLVLARDRFGIKPLYYYHNDSKFVFSSEIKAILKVPGIEKQINLEAVKKYFQYRHNFGEESFFCGIKKLPPGCYAIYRSGNLAIESYYRLYYCASSKLDISAHEAGERILELLADAVRYRLVADVEVALFLSSGLDSASILSLMSRFQQKVKAFCIGFGFDNDETGEAKRIAHYFGADFRKIDVTSADIDLLPQIVSNFDEPIGDSIIIPTYLLAKFASENVKVVLTGEGADEVFGGYVHQLAFYYVEKYLRHLPAPVLSLISRLIRILPPQLLSVLFPYPEKLKSDDRAKVASFLEFARDFVSTRKHMISLFEEEQYAGSALKSSRNNYGVIQGTNGNFFFHELDIDLNTWLVDYTLYKQDILTMANSLEGRVPFLDHRLVEFLCQLPMEQFIKGSNVKMPLRRAMTDKMPGKVLKAKKKAFYFPYHRLFGNAFISYVATIHGEAKKDHYLKEILNFTYFDSLIERSLSTLDLLNSKRLMAYIIFITWYRNYHR